MSESTAEFDLFHRYLSLLGVRVEQPDRPTLTKLVRAHLLTVPFENISKLHYRKKFGQTTPPTLEKYLDGIEQRHLGGTCYANNFHFYSLLKWLGYDASLCGADMTHPDVHVVSLVRVEDREFLVDVGYGGPFLEPMPRDLDQDYEINLGDDRYVLHPRDAEGRSRLDLWRKGELKHGFTVKPTPREIEYFDPVIADSFRPEATFMNAVLIVKYTERGARVLHNFSGLEIVDGQTHRKELSTCAEIADEAHRLFDMPREIVRDVLDELPNFRDAWK